MGHPHTYVDGDSEDYIFYSVGPNYPDPEGEHMEDYGKITNEGVIEILASNWETDDKELKDYIIKKLAEKLKVIMRDKPLTEKENDKLYNKIVKKWLKKLRERMKKG